MTLQTPAAWTDPSKIKYNSTDDHINLVKGDAESGGQQWHRVGDIGKCVLFLTRYNCTNLQLEAELGNEIYYDVGINQLICNVLVKFCITPVPWKYSLQDAVFVVYT